MLRREVQPPGIRRGLTSKARRKQRTAVTRGRTMANKLLSDQHHGRRFSVDVGDVVDVLWDLIDAVEGKET